MTDKETTQDELPEDTLLRDMEEEAAACEEVDDKYGALLLRHAADRIRYLEERLESAERMIEAAAPVFDRIKDLILELGIPDETKH